MLKFAKILMIPAALAMTAGAGIATAPNTAQAEIGLDIYIGPDGRRYYRRGPPPRYYYHAPRYRQSCYWDGYYQRYNCY